MSCRSPSTSFACFVQFRLLCNLKGCLTSAARPIQRGEEDHSGSSCSSERKRCRWIWGPERQCPEAELNPLWAEMPAPPPPPAHLGEEQTSGWMCPGMQTLHLNNQVLFLQIPKTCFRRCLFSGYFPQGLKCVTEIIEFSFFFCRWVIGRYRQSPLSSVIRFW